MKNKILFIDTETGGLDPSQVSLLSIGLVVWRQGELIDSKQLFVRPEFFKISPEAVRINKIDLLSFLDLAIKPKDVIDELKNFCLKNFSSEMPITLGGHNTSFDINFLKHFLKENNENFSDYFSHRFIDTASILKYLYYAEKVDIDLSSSDKAFNYFNINIKDRHTALGDAEGTANLFTKLLKLV